MLIVDKKKFYEYPEGTIYSQFEGECFSPLFRKGKNCVSDGIPTDHFLTWLTVDNDIEPDTFLDVGDRFNMIFSDLTRECEYNDYQLYAIWEESDLNDLVEVLQNGIKILKEEHKC